VTSIASSGPPRGPYKRTERAVAARVLRAGASQAEAARKANVRKRTIQRWLKDPEFAARSALRSVITVGHVPEPDAPPPATDLLDALPPSKAWISTSDRMVLGSVLHPLASHTITNNRDPETGRPRQFTAEVAASVVQVELVATPQRAAAVTTALSAGHAPDDEPDAIIVPLTMAGLLHVQRSPRRPRVPDSRRWRLSGVPRSLALS
jgi:hypothetical protein